LHLGVGFSRKLGQVLLAPQFKVWHLFSPAIIFATTWHHQVLSIVRIRFASREHQWSCRFWLTHSLVLAWVLLSCSFGYKN
jgi:hypothetical protein